MSFTTLKNLHGLLRFGESCEALVEFGYASFDGGECVFAVGAFGLGVERGGFAERCGEVDTSGVVVGFFSQFHVGVGHLAVPAYSMECTNIPNYIRKTANETSLIKPSLVTSAILTATVYEKDETAGTYTPVDLVLYNGVYYKKEQFIKYALSRLDAAQPLNFYICTNPDAAEGETRKYRQVTDTDVKLAKKADNYTGSWECWCIPCCRRGLLSQLLPRGR